MSHGSRVVVVLFLALTACGEHALDDAAASTAHALATHPARGVGAGREAARAARFKRPGRGACARTGTCESTGCPAPPAASCLFGDTFYDLRTEPMLTIVDEHWVRSLEELATELEAEQLVIAVRQSSHTEVTTAAQALAAVDQNEARRMRLRDEETRREYDVFEYGAGDNSYGAIFAADSLEKVASIHDGDFLACSE